VNGPPPAVAAVRVAVRRSLADLDPGCLVLVALSGGPDSLALLAGTVFERPGRTGAVIVDHGWHPASAEVAATAAGIATGLGADPVLVVRTPPGPPSEAGARAARYDALADAARERGAAAVLLGHTRDDQAETVLLGLARGSGARSLAGMAPRRDIYRRPLLDLPRATTTAACRAQGLDPVRDPANVDDRYTRARVRRRVLPVLERELGPGVGAALARTAAQLRADADLLDALAADAGAELTSADGLDCAGLAELPAALRSRVLRRATGAATAVQVHALDALVTDWRGQGAVALPGGRWARREHGRIRVVPAPDAPPDHLADPAVLIPAEDISRRVGELAAQITADYQGREVMLVGVLKGAIMFMADLSRALDLTVSLEFMAISSYGAATSTSGVVRILKDLDRDITGAHVLVVEDVIDSGLTLSWLLRNLSSRGPATLEVCALLRKPDAVALGLPVRYVGFDIDPHFVVGYGLDAAERYRTLPYIGLLAGG
jgi:hypoxanthine phosphoribosyltransferase